MISEFAPAKVNLTLHVGPPRSDGYHPLESLVFFADFGDVLEVTPAQEDSLSLSGPFSQGLEAEPSNLVLRAARFARAQWPHAPFAAFHLKKNLPVASGLGGGSADAAAALRALGKLAGKDPLGLKGVETLGADIPVCLYSRPALMGGIGEKVTLIDAAPKFLAVLVNPGVPVSTREIFKALDAAPRGQVSLTHEGGDFGAKINAGRNDLEGPAITLSPKIKDALGALSLAPGAHLVRMSGSGASCFALFETAKLADQAARQIAKNNPAWWVKAVTLGEGL